MFNIKTVAATLLALSITPVLSIGVQLQRFSDSNCNNQIESYQINANGCQKYNGQVSSSYKLNTNTEGTGWFPCGDGNSLIVQTWQSSDSCSGSPDSTIGPIPDYSQPGSCGLTPIRSFQIQCA